MRPLIVLALLGLASTANAQNIWNSPHRGPRYSVELEPHLALGPFSPPGDGSGSGVGPGIRVSIPLSREGILPAFNDSVALGVGLDWLFYAGVNRRGHCTQFEQAPGGGDVCVEVDGQGGDTGYFFVPLVAQWNFFLQERISLFAEPGVNFFLRQNELEKAKFGISPNIQVGGRFMFTDRFEAVLRLGYPTVTLGVGLLL